MRKIMPVDKYINKGFGKLCSERQEESICSAVSYEEHELYYGLTNSEATGRQAVYHLNKKYPEKIVVLFRCEHKGRKFKHHPNYEKPFEVEILCQACHSDRHRELLDTVFNVPFSIKGRKYRDDLKKILDKDEIF